MAGTFQTNLLRARVPKQRQEEEERGALLAQVPGRHRVEEEMDNGNQSGSTRGATMVGAKGQ